MSSLRRSRLFASVLACAVCFVAGGLVIPRVGMATVSSGDRAAFFPLPPARILDTRFGPSPLAVGLKVGPGQSIDLAVGGQGGVPPSAAAVVLNVTATEGTASSHLTIYPTGQPFPTASNLNFGANDTIPNGVTVKLGTAGKVTIFNNSGDVHVIADVNGYYENQNFDDLYYRKAEVDTQVATAIAGVDATVASHNHDDLYYRKAEADTKVATAITTPNHITGGQVVDGSLSLNDITGSGSFLMLNLFTITVPGSACLVKSVSLGASNAFKLLVPIRIGLGIPNSAFLSASPVVLNVSGVAALQICNSSVSGFGPVTSSLEYYLS